MMITRDVLTVVIGREPPVTSAETPTMPEIFERTALFSTYCFYGVGRRTVETMTYANNFVSGNTPGIPTNTFGDGDGTVNLKSSEICLKWRTMPSPFNTMTFNGVSHVGMVVILLCRQNHMEGRVGNDDHA